MRNGTSITQKEHHQRFSPEGRYSIPKIANYRVVDFRSSTPNDYQVQPNHILVVLNVTDWKTATIFIPHDGHSKIYTVDLKGLLE